MPTSPSRQRAQAASMCVVAAAFILVGTGWTLFFLATGTLAGLDVARVDVGILCALKDAMARGDGPWVSALLGNGGALWARPEVQAAYPPRWLQLLLAPDAGATLGAVLHWALAAASTAGLARTFGVRPWASAAAGMSFALCGTVVDLASHGPYLVAAPWVPLAWAGARSMVRGPASSGVLMVACGMALLLLGGEPQSAVVTGCILVGEAAACARHGRRAAAVLILGAATAGGLVGLTPWWSTLAEMELTRRGVGLSTDEALYWSATWRDLLAVAWPNAFVPGVDGFSAHVALAGPDARLPWNATPYLGPWLLFLAALGARRRSFRGVVLVGAVALLLATPAATAPGRWLHENIPMLRTFRYPAKYLLHAHLCACLLAGAGLHRLLRARAGARRVAWLLAGTLMVLVAATVLVPRLAAAGPVVNQLADLLLARVTVPALVLLVCALVMAAGTGDRRGLVVALVLDVGAAAVGAVSTGRPVADAPSVADLVRRAFPGTPPVVCVQGTLERITASDPAAHGPWDARAWFDREWLVPETQACSGVSSAVPYSPLETRAQRALSARVNGGDLAAARALGCDVVAVDGSLAAPVLHAEPVAPGAPRLALHVVPGALPRAFIIPAPVLRRDLEAALFSPGAHPADHVDDPLGRGVTAVPNADAAAAVTVMDARADAYTLRVTGTRTAVVGVRTAFLAGWGAFQAGGALPVVRVGGALLGVVVADASLGPVELRYRPPRLAVGVVSAVTGLVLLAALCMLRPRGLRAGSAVLFPSP